MTWKRRSVDLRQQAVSAFEQGMAVTQVLTVFGVSRSSLYRWKERQRQDTLTDIPSQGGPRKITSEDEGKLLAQLQAFPDATIEQHRLRWQQEQHQTLSHPTMRRAIKRVNWTYKKSV